MDLAITLVVVLGAIGVIGFAALEGRNDGVAAWQAAAGQVGGEVGRSPRHGLRADIGGVEVRAAAVDHLGARARHTRVWARARVRPQARLAIGTRRRRLQSIALDPTLTGWTDRPRHVAARWTAGDSQRWRQVRRRPDGDDPTCRLISDGHLVELVVDYMIEDTDRLVAAIELVARIASDDLGAVTALADLPGATVVPGALAVRLSPDDVVVEIDPLTSATAIHGTAEVGAARVRVRSSDELERVRRRWATPDVVAAFAASGAATLDVSLGESRLSWLKLELDGERLRAGIALIRRIAGGDHPTPYR